MWLKRAILALIALLIPGCSREPTLKWLLDGRIEIPVAEREALRTLFADVKSSKVDVVIGQGLLGGYGARAVQIDGGHVVGLATSGAISPEALSALPELRRLVLFRSQLENLEGLGPWPLLSDLQLEFAALQNLDGIADCCPALQELHLAQSALTSLSTTPSLPSLKTFYLTSGPLQSLAGIENFSGLEVLQLFGVKSLLDLSDLPSLPHLRELRLFQNGLTALTGLPELPALEIIEASDNKILSAQLGELPKLREIEMHEADLLSLELGVLPSLETVDLLGEGSLFKDGGRLRRLLVAAQPKLERLDLRRNHLRDLAGLAPQPNLWQIQLDRNPFDGLDHFTEELQNGFPALRHISVRRTRVSEVPTELMKSGLTLSHDPSETEANMWEGVLREAFEKIRSTFVEKLPPGSGRLEGHVASSSLQAATFSTPRLNASGKINRLSGLVPLYLIQVDPLSPGGGQNRFPVRATIRVRQGRARIYLKYELDIRGQAEALASYRDPERPWFEFGDSRDADDFKQGFAFAEARPGSPGSTSGEAHQLVDQLVVWIEGLDGAEGIEYVLESPYR